METVGAFIGRPHFGEHTQTSPTAYTNSKSKIKTLTSDNKGITLIALVITIIVMLILVAVTVTIAINGGLFSTAKQAKADTQANIDAEQRLASGRIKVDGKWYDSLEDYTKGKKSENQSDVQGDEPQTSSGDWKLNEDGNSVSSESKNVTLNIGDYVDYKPEPETTTYESTKLGKDYTGSTSNSSNLTTDDLKWRVLGVDTKGCLTLVSDMPDSKNGYIYFEGAKGYNNGVYILNDICEKLYSNTKLGIKARSITIEDIEAGFDEEGKKARDEYKNTSNTQYGKTKTYGSSLNYPVIYKEEKGSGVGTTTVKETGIEGSDPFYKTENELTNKTDNKESDTATSNLTCTQTYYYFISTPENYCKNKEFYNMIFKTNTYYWLASRYVDCTSSYAYFELILVGDTNLNGIDLFSSDADPSGSNHSLRPVVSLGSNIEIQTVTDNSVSTPHKILGLE